MNSAPSTSLPAAVFAPEDLAGLTHAEAHKRLNRVAPHAFRGYILLATDFLTDRRRSCDAALILADRLREVADDASSRQSVPRESPLITSVLTLAEVLTEAAPYLPGGALAAVAP